MVSSVMRALLVQAFFAFHVRASISAADLAGAEAVLRELIKREAGEICGSGEIYKILAGTAKTNSRLALWTKIETISSTHLSNMDKLMKETLQKLDDAKRRLEEKKNQEFEEMTGDELEPIITKAVLQGGFDASDGKQAVASAQLSLCGMMSPRKCKKKDPKCLLTSRDTLEDTLKAFKNLMESTLDQVKKRAQGDMIYDKCVSMFPIENDENEMSYCDQMCEKFSQDGAAASDALFSQTAGATSDDIQQEIDMLTELGKKYKAQNSKCEEAQEALKGFKLSLAPLEEAIEITFDAWKKANTALGEAEEELEDLEDQMDAEAETLEELTSKVLASETSLQNAVMKLTKVKTASIAIKANHKSTLQKLKEAQNLQDDGTEALRAAELIKEKVAGIIEASMRLYNFFVHEPLRNLMLDDPETMKVFDQTDEATSAEALKESMENLKSHCETEAKPAFAKISGLDLSPLCEFGGDEAAKGIFEVVAQRKEAVKGELKECQDWWVDFEIPHSDEKDNSELTEPELLSTVVEEYGEVSFASEYMPNWRTGDRFLGAIAALRKLLIEVEAEIDALNSKINQLVELIAANAQLVGEVMAEVKEAIRLNKVAVQNKEEAQRILEEHQEEQRDQQSNIEKLREAAKAAKEAYHGAMGKFSEVFKAGTVSLVQGKQVPSSMKLKTVKRLG